MSEYSLTSGVCNALVRGQQQLKHMGKHFFHSYRTVMFTGGLDCMQTTSAMSFGKNYLHFCCQCALLLSVPCLQAAVQSEGLQRVDE